jgi:hypothetical protein
MQQTLVYDLKQLKETCKQIDSARTDAIHSLIDSVQMIKQRASELTAASLEKIEHGLRETRKEKEKYEREQRVLDSLRFHTMHDRYYNIAEAHRKTFEWVFDPDSTRCKVTLKDWLVSGTGIYWISGKPGSGKSTFLKYLCDCKRTLDHLRIWAGSDRLATASFYFWAGGTEMQRSRRGLFQQLLFEILRQCPDFISAMAPEVWPKSGPLTNLQWSESQLETAFRSLRGLTADTKICFFIDGLDEYTGDQGDRQHLIEVLRTISDIPNIKLCVSSRPWVCFQSAFGTDPRLKLRLEELTVDDIASFARDKLEEIPGFVMFKQETESYVDLVQEIVRRAEGVFLWVFLVVRSLRDGLTNEDNISLLRKRLDELPSDLEHFFKKLIDSVDKIYQRQMAITFQVALRSPGPLSLLTHWFIDEEDTSWMNQLPPRMEDRGLFEQRMSRRLYGRYKGLLEVSKMARCKRVNFIHRTLRDYLTDNARELFSLPGLNPCVKACRALLKYVKFFEGLEGGIYSFNNMEYFVVFARFAEMDGEAMDYSLIEQMRAATSEWGGNDTCFLGTLVQFGYTSGLQSLLSKNPGLVQRRGSFMLKAALDPYDTTAIMARSVFGVPSAVSSAVNTVSWLLENGASPHLSTPRGKEPGRNMFLDFSMRQPQTSVATVISSQNGPDSSAAYDQWKRSLLVLLRHGADYKQIFDNSRTQSDLPFIGSAGRLASAVRKSLSGSGDDADRGLWKAFAVGCLFRLVHVYCALLDHGLDPHRPISRNTLWQIWLRRIVQWQTDHGLFEEPCAEAIAVFLSKGANPYESVFVDSDRVDHPRLTVSTIVDTYFGEQSRERLEPALAAAMNRWPHQNSGTEDSRGSRLKRSYSQYDQDITVDEDRRQQPKRERPNTGKRRLPESRHPRSSRTWE